MKCVEAITTVEIKPNMEMFTAELHPSPSHWQTVFQMMITVHRIAFFLRSPVTTCSNHTTCIYICFLQEFDCKRKRHNEENFQWNYLDVNNYICSWWFGKMLDCLHRRNRHMAYENWLLCEAGASANQHILVPNVSYIDSSLMQLLQRKETENSMNISRIWNDIRVCW